jgi:hypothetical protein
MQKFQVSNYNFRVLSDILRSIDRYFNVLVLMWKRRAVRHVRAQAGSKPPVGCLWCSGRPGVPEWRTVTFIGGDESSTQYERAGRSLLSAGLPATSRQTQFDFQGLTHGLRYIP